MMGVLTRLWLLAAFSICVVSIWAHMQIGMDNDHMVLMEQAQKMLAGAIPYVDYTDVSPPLIHLIYVMPIMLAKWTGIRLADALNIFTMVLIVWSIWLSDKILESNNASKLFRQLAATAFGLALLGASFIHQPFGDRDHLLMVLATPWFVLYSPLARRYNVAARWRMMAAAMAAVAFAIKPYSYVFYLATILFERWQGKSLRGMATEAEHWIVIGFALIYVTAVFHFFPQYPLTMLPLGWETYGVLGWDIHGKVGVVQNEFFSKYLMTGALGTAVIWLFVPERCDRLLGYVFVLLGACIGSYLLNGGWYYTQYPFIAVALVLAVLTGCRLAIIAPNQKWAVILCGLILAGGVHFFADPAVFRAGWDIQLTHDRGHPLSTFEPTEKAKEVIDKALSDHPRFMYLGISMWGVNFLKEGTPREEIGRFDYLWPLPGILAMEGNPAKREDYRKWASYMQTSIADDLVRRKPELVINDISQLQRSLPAAYNVLSFLRKNSDFADAWKGYRLETTIHSCTQQEQANCAYEIYVRR